MSTVPVPAGEVVVISVAETTVNDVARVDPNSTVLALVIPVPRTTTDVPPVSGPAVGVTEVTMGRTTYVNLSAAEVGDVPPGVVTVMFTVPTEPAGEATVICVPDTTVTVVPGFAPNNTDVAPLRFVPVTVTDVPPTNGPADGETPVTVGAATNVYWSALEVAEVPPGDVTVMSTVPADSAGATAVICVAEFTMKLFAAVPPKSTTVAGPKFVPEMTTLVPDVVGPADGDTPVTVGTASYVNWSADEVAEVPPGVVTMKSRVPGTPAGTVVMISVEEIRVKLTELPPRETTVAPVNPKPVIVTAVPPDNGPAAGNTEVTTGGP